MSSYRHKYLTFRALIMYETYAGIWPETSTQPIDP